MQCHIYFINPSGVGVVKQHWASKSPPTTSKTYYCARPQIQKQKKLNVMDSNKLNNMSINRVTILLSL